MERNDKWNRVIRVRYSYWNKSCLVSSISADCLDSSNGPFLFKWMGLAQNVVNIEQADNSYKRFPKGPRIRSLLWQHAFQSFDYSIKSLLVCHVFIQLVHVEHRKCASIFQFLSPRHSKSIRKLSNSDPIPCHGTIVILGLNPCCVRAIKCC